MKFAGVLAMFLALVLWIGNAVSAPVGKSIEFAGGGAGKVVLDGKVHADKGLKCPDCHTNPKLFAMKKGADKITMAEMNAGKNCGTCHNGTKAFKSGDPANCGKCHKAGGAGAGAGGGGGGGKASKK